MGRRFQSGDSITFPVPAALSGLDGGPLTIVVVGKVNTSAYQCAVYTRSSGAHGWWVEYDTTGGLHVNYGTGTTPRPIGSVTAAANEIHTGRKDSGGTFQPVGRHFTGASFATDSGDITAASTLVDGTAIDTSYSVQFGRWGNTGSDYSNDLVLYLVAVHNSILSGATLAAMTKTAAGVKSGATYWASFEGSGTPTDSAGGTPTVTGTTTVSDPSGFFSSGFSAALPVATETSTAVTLGRTKSKVLPPATETSSGIAFGRTKSGLLVLAAETSSTVLLGRTKAGAFPVAAETSTALAPGRTKSAALPPAVETSSAVALGRTKVGLLPPATETSTALEFGTPDEGLVQELPVAIETSSAVALGRAKAGLLPPAMETDTAVALVPAGLVQALPVAVDTSTASTWSVSKGGELPPAYEYSTAVTLGGGAPEGGEAMQLGAIMDEIAARLRQAPTLAGRTTAYPPGSVKAPAAIVTYPDSYQFDGTYGRGMDRIKGEVVVVVGRPTDRSTRDRLTRYVDGSGPESVKALVDGDDYASCDSVRVESALFDTFKIGGVDYLAAVFSVDIVGRGAVL